MEIFILLVQTMNPSNIANYRILPKHADLSDYGVAWNIEHAGTYEECEDFLNKNYNRYIR
jgi:hypothetical protein